jgi:hypothetical protein
VKCFAFTFQRCSSEDSRFQNVKSERGAGRSQTPEPAASLPRVLPSEATSRLLPYPSMCHSPRRHAERHTKGGGHTNTSNGTDVASEEPTAAASRRPTRRPMKHLRYADPKTCPPSVRVTTFARANQRSTKQSVRRAGLAASRPSGTLEPSQASHSLPVTDTSRRPLPSRCPSLSPNTHPIA